MSKIEQRSFNGAASLCGRGSLAPHVDADNFYTDIRIGRDAKTLQTYKPGLEEGFGQKFRKVLLLKIKFYFVSIVLISVENNHQ